MIKKEQLDILFKAISKGMSITDSCILANIGRNSFYRKCENDKDFKSLVDKAQLEWKQGLIDTIQKASINNWTAAAWLLERQYPDEFALKHRLEHSGNPDNPIQIIVKGTDLSKLPKSKNDNSKK